MRIQYFLAVIILHFFPLSAFDDFSPIYSSGQTGFLPGTPRYTLMNVNQISHWLRNDGQFGENPNNMVQGIVFPRGTTATVYVDGLVWGGYIHDGNQPVLRVGGQSYWVGTVPGSIRSIGVGQDPNDPEVRIYRIRRDWLTVADDVLRLDAAEFFEIDPSQVTQAQIDGVRTQYAVDWQEWPVGYGAPFYDLNRNGIYEPHSGETPGLLNADQVIWFVCNDLDAITTRHLYGSPPVGIELQFTGWAFEQSGAATETVFRRYRLINKSGYTIDSMFVALWSDVDLGDYFNDFVGCDTLLDMGYVYNGVPLDNAYSQFGLVPPAFGYVLLQGPLVHSPGDSAFFDFKPRMGYRNLKMTSFYYDGSGNLYGHPSFGDYEGTMEWYQILNGFIPWSDTLLHFPFYYGSGPNIFQTTKFPLNGDPVAGIGDIDGEEINLAAGSRELAVCSGPFHIHSGDTQEVIYALVGGLGHDYLNSITQLKSNVSRIHSFFGHPRPLPRGQIHMSYPDGYHSSMKCQVDLQEFSGINAGHILFESQNEMGTPFTLPLYDDGLHGDSLPGDGIWANELMVNNRQYPYRGNVILQTNTGSDTFPGIYSRLRLRPIPEILNWQVVWENGRQDRMLNNGEQVHLGFTVFNRDSINPISFFRIANEIYGKNFTEGIPPGQTVSSDSLYVVLKGPQHSNLINFTIEMKFDDHVIQQDFQYPISHWIPQAGWRDTLQVIQIQGFPNNILPLVADPPRLTGHQYLITFFEGSDSSSVRWQLEDLNTGEIKISAAIPNSTLFHAHPVVDGIEFQVKDGNQDDFFDFLTVANAAGVLNPAEGAAADWMGFPGTGRPGERQQVGEGKWLIHCGMLTPHNGDYHSFKEYVTRFNSFAFIRHHDFELRFTAEGGEAKMFYSTGTIVHVPFEIWNIGCGTPEDSTDDYRMIPYLKDVDRNDRFNLASSDHAVSDGNDDPETDYIYFMDPSDRSPGVAGYQAVINSGWTRGIRYELLARITLVNWDGGDVSDPAFPANINQVMPETGTTFRIISAKPNSVGDAIRVTGKLEYDYSSLYSFELFQNYPNPFNAGTTIRFRLPRTGRARVEIFNILGQKVRTLLDTGMDWGIHEVRWDGRNETGNPVGSGIYFYRLISGENIQTCKMVILN